MIKYLEKNNFNEEIKDGKVLVDFYADWCGPCKMLGEVLLELEDLNILKVNVDEHPEIAKEYGVMSIPTLIIFKEGQEVNKNIGFMNNVIYIYRCVPVLSAIEEVTSVDTCFISRKEINEFINRFNVDFKFNDDFKLSDHSTWKF